MAHFVLDTDASDYGIGVVLSQEQEGMEKVIAYSSRALTKSERNYCVTRKELLAVVYFVKYFRMYLYGRKFTIRTDHGALKWLFGFKDPAGQVARWIQTLAEYDLGIQHRPGHRHGNADAMSRTPCLQCHRAPESCSGDPLKEERQVTGSEVEAPVHTKAHEIDGTVIREQDVTSDDQKPPDDRKTQTLKCMTAKRTESNWLQGWTSAELREKQLGDPVLRQVIGWLEDKVARPTWPEVSAENSWLKMLWGAWNQLCIHGGVFHKKWEDDTSKATCW